MFDDAAAACKAARNTDLEIKSNYQAGALVRVHRRARDRDPALQARRRRSTRSTATPTTRCCARPRSGRRCSNGSEGRHGAVGAARQVPARRQRRRGDVAARLAGVARAALRRRDQVVERADPAGAARRQLLRRGPGRSTGSVVRTPRRQDLPKAIEKWQETVRSYPAAYYALLALNRLREAAPQQFQALVAEISTDPPGYDPKAPAFTFKPRPEYATPGFARAMELLRLGLGEPADAELKKLGLTTPSDKQARRRSRQAREAVGDGVPLRPRRTLRDVASGRRAGTSLDYRRAWPVGANREKWQIAFPQGVLAAADASTRRSTTCRSRCRSASCARRAGSIRSTRATRTRSGSPR